MTTNNGHIKIFSPTSWPAENVGGPVESLHRNCLAFSELGYFVEVISTKNNLNSQWQEKTFHKVNKNYIIQYNNSIYSFKVLMKLFKCHHNEVIIIEDYFWIFNYFLIFILKFSGIGQVYIVPRGVLGTENIVRKSPIKKKVFIFIFEFLVSILKIKLIYIFTSKLECQSAKEVCKVKFSYIIPNRHSSVEIAPSNSPKIDLRKRQKNILIVSRLTKSKRVFQSIKVIDSLRSKFDINLIICGSWGDDSQKIKDFLDENGDWIQYLGELDQRQLKYVYEHSDALLSCSRNENFGNVFLEAINSGCPIVTNNTNPWEIVNCDKSGICVTDEFCQYVNALEKVLIAGKKHFAPGCNLTSKRFSKTSINKAWNEAIVEKLKF